MAASVNTSSSAQKAYEKYADMLFRLSYSLLLSKEDAEDAVAEVFSSYIEKPSVFVNDEHEKAWFIRVTVNKCKDLLRKRTIRAYTPLEEVLDLAAKEKEDSGILSEVMRLPEKYKTVILLYYFEDLSIKQISSTLKISKSAVKMRLVRGRELLGENKGKEE